jgi:hypothetical protein
MTFAIQGCLEQAKFYSCIGWKSGGMCQSSMEKEDAVSNGNDWWSEAYFHVCFTYDNGDADLYRRFTVSCTK